MPEAGLNKTPRTKSVVAPGLDPLTLSTHPVSEKIAIIQIGSVGVSAIRIENPRSVVGLRSTILEVSAKIRVTGLDSKIQFIEFGDLRQVHPRPKRGIPPLGYGPILVFSKCIRVTT